MAGCPSGQREQTVNLPASPTLVRTQHLPPARPVRARAPARRPGPRNSFPGTRISARDPLLLPLGRTSVPRAPLHAGTNGWIMDDHSLAASGGHAGTGLLRRGWRRQAPMAELVCRECGEANDFDAEFCAYCHAFLAWDEPQRAGSVRGATGARAPVAGEQVIETQVMPRVQVDGGPVDGQRRTVPRRRTSEDGSSGGLFQASTEQHEVTVPATGEPATLEVRVTNASTIVDGYRLEAVGAPPWLTVESDQVELLPDATQALRVRLRISSSTLVPAQVLPTVLRVSSMEQAPAYVDLPVRVTVPVVDVPVQLRAEPRLLRVRDAETVEFTVLADSRSNRPVQLRFGGSDPEL